VESSDRSRCVPRRGHRARLGLGHPIDRLDTGAPTVRTHRKCLDESYRWGRIVSECGIWFLGDIMDGSVYTGDDWSFDKTKALPLNACQALEALEDVDNDRMFRDRILPLSWEELANFEENYTR